MARNGMMQLHMLAICVIGMTFPLSFDFIFSYLKSISFPSDRVKVEIK